MKIKVFTFNPFQENTYLLYDDTRECAIIDPGCMNRAEEKELTSFIEDNGLKPVLLLNTHCHIDHILGNRYVSQKWSLPLQAHKDDVYNIESAELFADSYGMPSPSSPKPEKFLEEGQTITFGNTGLNVFFTPGHSAGHVVFYNEDGKTVIGGDVLFRNSIGRYDLPGGSLQTLLASIREKLFTLPDDVTVYPGHGPETTIGYEKEHNPFLND